MMKLPAAITKDVWEEYLMSWRNAYIFKQKK